LELINNRKCTPNSQQREKRAEATKQQRELEGESVAFAVMAHLGMRVESRFYLATYDVTREMLTASLATINAAALQLIEVIGEPISLRARQSGLYAQVENSTTGSNVHRGRSSNN
jgi:hypothetical protein